MFSFYFLKIGGNLALGGRPHRALHNALELDPALFLSVGKQTGGVEREGQGGTVDRDTHCGS